MQTAYKTPELNNQSTISKDNPENPNKATQQTLKNHSFEIPNQQITHKSLNVSPKGNHSELKMAHSLSKFPYQYSHIPMRKQLPQWNKSAAVLRHTSQLFSVPKAQRFPNPKVNYFNHYHPQIPSTLSNRKAAFGYGSKAPVPQVFKAHHGQATQKVPFYEVDDMTLRRNKSESIKKGKTFGQSWSSFKNVRAPHRPTVHISEQVKANPGHKYIISPNTGSQTRKNSIHARLRMFSEDRAYHKRQQPGPQNYLILESQTKQGSLKTNFGKGNKSDFTKSREHQRVPGPIYKISGFCDKFRNTQLKNLPRK